MADTPNYGYNKAGQWTILQPGEEEWNSDPAAALKTLYGNDTTSLLGQYYQAGGNFGSTGGLMSTAGASPADTSITDTVYNYTRPRTSKEQLANRDAQNEWTNMFLNSPVYNKNGANSYAIQTEPLSTSNTRVSDESKWTNWATQNNYIAPTTPTNPNTNTGTTATGANINTPLSNTNVTAPETRTQLPTSTTPGVTYSNITNTASNTATPYLGRLGANRSASGAFSNSPVYNQFEQPNKSGLNEGTGLRTDNGNLGLSNTGGRSGINFSRAIWR
jgi:hypothetical protein